MPLCVASSSVRNSDRPDAAPGVIATLLSLDPDRIVLNPQTNIAPLAARRINP